MGSTSVAEPIALTGAPVAKGVAKGADVAADNAAGKAAIPAVEGAADKSARRASQKIQSPDDGWVYLLLGALTAGAWWLSTLKLFTSRSDLGYWLGVAGGCTMLGVFAYPMRKHLRFMQRWGAGKHWFIVHMMVGVIGPVLILVHSTFAIGSINAGVALFSMIIVALSGVVGRFLYVRLHRGLHGQRLTLEELRQKVSGDEEAVARLHFVPRVQADLRAFETLVLGARRSVLHVVFGSPALTLRRWLLERRCHAQIRRRLDSMAGRQEWSDQDRRRRLKRTCALVSDFLKTTQRIAEFAVWERLFSLWHVVHVPFVYMMVLSAIAHVIAVHAY